MHQKKGILVLSAIKSTSPLIKNNDMVVDMSLAKNCNNVKKLIPKKRVKFDESDPEIIGFCISSSDDVDEDDNNNVYYDGDELNFVQNTNEKLKNDNDEDDNDQVKNLDDDYSNNDDDSDESDLELKKLTVKNTLFNSNYVNFNTSLSDGVLGRPKSTNENNNNDGTVKFKITASYQSPTETFIINQKHTTTNSIRQMFEKNQQQQQNQNFKTKTNDDDMTTTTKTSPLLNVKQNNDIGKNKENEKRLVVNVNVRDDVFQNNINQKNIIPNNAGGSINDNNNNNNNNQNNNNNNNNDNQQQQQQQQNVPKIPKVKLQSATTVNVNQTSDLKKKIKEIDIDRIRIPRASIQSIQNSSSSTTATTTTTKITLPSSNVNNFDRLKLTKTAITNQQINVINDNINDDDVDDVNDDTSMMVLVDNREGSILTLDTLKLDLSKIDQSTAINDENELFYLPSINNKIKSKNNTNNNKNNNCDTLSQSSSSSGCCTNSLSASASSSSTSSSSSSSPHSTSPTNIETCSSSNESSPDSLESSPDSNEPDSSYDSTTSTSSSSSVTKHHLDNNDFILETVIEEENYNGNDDDKQIFQYKNNSNEQQQQHHDDVFKQQQAKNLVNQSIITTTTTTSMANHQSSNKTTTFNQNDDYIEKFNDNKDNTDVDDDDDDGIDENYVVFQPNRSPNTTTLLNNKNETKSESRHHTSTTIVINSNGSSEITTQLKHSDSLSSEDRRNLMLAKMAQDLQQHRNDQNSPSLSRSDSNQSSIIISSNKPEESFRERLFREAYETNYDDADDDRNLFGKFKKGLSSDDDSSDDCDDEKHSSDISDDDDDGDNNLNDGDVNNLNQKFSDNKFVKKKTKISKLFKNIQTQFINTDNKKKYKKMVQKNLRKTSKFIQDTTEQIRSSDMVKRLKNDKKSLSKSTTEKNGICQTKNGKWNLKMGSSSSTTKPHQNNLMNNGITSTSTSNETLNEEQPTLVKIKRLESTKYIRPTPLLNDNAPILPPSTKSKVIYPLMNNIKEENDENQPPNDNVECCEPPKPPLRRAKAIKQKNNVNFSAEKILSSLEQDLIVLDHNNDDVDDIVDIIEEFKISIKDCRFYRMKLKSLNNNEAHLLTSKTFWVTCYDKTFRQYHYNNNPCIIMKKKWSDFLTINTFCDRINRCDANVNRQILFDSIVLQLYHILARFEKGTTNNNVKNRRHRRPLTVGDINDALVGIYVDDDDKIMDVLLLLPSKMIDVDNDNDNNNDDDDDKNSLELDSLSMMQAFCLQVFLMRLTRLISTNHQQSDKQQKSNHYSNVSKRLQTFNTIRELKLLSAIDIFHLVDSTEKDSKIIQKQIDSWYNGECNELRRYIDNNSMRTILDYLRLDFIENTTKSQIYDLIYKDRLE